MDNKIVVPRFYVPWPHQTGAWERRQSGKYKYYVKLWARQMGKDTDDLQWLLKRAWDNPGSQSSYIGFGALSSTSSSETAGRDCFVGLAFPLAFVLPFVGMILPSANCAAITAFCCSCQVSPSSDTFSLSASASKTSLFINAMLSPFLDWYGWVWQPEK